jgi:hypothetical protein
MTFSQMNARAARFPETLLSLFLVWTAASGVLFAQEDTAPPYPGPPVPPSASLDEIFPLFPELRDRALVCAIEARVVEAENEIAWQAADSKVTISGRPVSLKLAGDNVVIALQFTPYIHFQSRGAPAGYLVIQGQIWVNKDDGSMHYQGVMRSIPISMGEKIHFLPLGPRKRRQESSIEIFLELLPYTESEENPPGLQDNLPAGE